MRQVILGIDFQFDFCNPQGSLFVKGAEKDVKRASEFIKRNINSIDDIILSMDSHQPVHIAHQIYWKNSIEEQPPLYSTITKDDVKENIWIPQYNADVAFDYLSKLEDGGDICTIWPPHCIIGTGGWCIDEELFESIRDWALAKGKSYELVLKGMHQATEHYSIFKAAVEYSHIETTLFNSKLVEKLKEYDRIFVMGEAADFCVLNSLKDLLHAASQIAPKICVLTDCMSYIVENNLKATTFFEEIKKLGVTFCDSTSV